MSKSVMGSRASPTGTPQPSLLASHAATQDHNVLDALDNAPSSHGPASRPHWAVWFGIPFLAIAGWAVSALLPSPSKSLPDADAIAKTAAPLANPAVAPQATASTWTREQNTAVEMESTHTPNFFPNNTGENAPAIKAPTPPLTEHVTATPSTRAPQVSDRLSADTTSTPKRRHIGSPPPAKAQPKPPIAPVYSIAKSASSKSPLAQAKASAAADPDVELLDAIMKHMGDGRRTSAGSASSSQSIATLVKSCKAQDKIEALVCQRQICEGSWGKAQACPPNLAPKSHQKPSASGPPA